MWDSTGYQLYWIVFSTVQKRFLIHAFRTEPAWILIFDFDLIFDPCVQDRASLDFDFDFDLIFDPCVQKKNVFRTEPAWR